jgi:hypothetical protein
MATMLLECGRQFYQRKKSAILMMLSIFLHSSIIRHLWVFQREYCHRRDVKQDMFAEFVKVLFALVELAKNETGGSELLFF